MEERLVFPSERVCEGWVLIVMREADSINAYRKLIAVLLGLPFVLQAFSSSTTSLTIFLKPLTVQL